MTNQADRRREQAPNPAAPCIESIGRCRQGHSFLGINAVEYVAKRVTLVDADEVVLRRKPEFTLMLVCSATEGHAFHVRGKKADITRSDLLACSIRTCFHRNVQQAYFHDVAR